MDGVGSGDLKKAAEAALSRVNLLRNDNSNRRNKSRR